MSDTTTTPSRKDPSGTKTTTKTTHFGCASNSSQNVVQNQSPQSPMKQHLHPIAQSTHCAPTRPLHSLYVPPRTYHPFITPSRSVYCYERLIRLKKARMGVFRARDKQTGDIVALKKLKLDEEKHGFPITALREINALMSCRHDNVVGIREVVVGDTLTQYVSCVLYSCSYSRLPKSIRRNGFYWARPQVTPHGHANSVPSVRNQNAHASTPLRCGPLPFQWILHRDLKTSNLLMNNRGTIKVADFGLPTIWRPSGRRWYDTTCRDFVVSVCKAFTFREVFLSIHVFFSSAQKYCWVHNLLHAVDMWSVGLHIRRTPA